MNWVHKIFKQLGNLKKLRVPFSRPGKFWGKGILRNTLQLTQIIQTLLTECKEEQLVDSSSFSDVRTSDTISSDVSNLDGNGQKVKPE